MGGCTQEACVTMSFSIKHPAGIHLSTEISREKVVCTAGLCAFLKKVLPAFASCFFRQYWTGIRLTNNLEV